MKKRKTPYYYATDGTLVHRFRWKADRDQWVDDKQGRWEMRANTGQIMYLRRNPPESWPAEIPR